MIKRMDGGVRSGITDSLFLLGAVLVSALPYIFGLGLYSDDWWTIPFLVRTSGEGFFPMLHQFIHAGSDLRLRPIRGLYLALSFKAFGRQMLAYHVAGTIALGIAAIFLYLALRELLASRTTAFAIALVFALLPHYSTDRVWFASHQATLCMLFAFAGVFALLRLVRIDARHSKAWAAVAVVSFGLSILSYEVAFGMIAASLLVAAYLAYRNERVSLKRILVGFAGIGALLAGIVLAKERAQTRIAYHHHFFAHFWALVGHAIAQAVQFNVWTYGLHMPAVLAGLYRHSALTLAAYLVSALLGCLVAAYLWCTLEPSSIPTRRASLRLIACGFLIFALGYALFLPGIEVNFSTMGNANRIAIGSAPGAACVLVAFAGLLSSICTSPVARTKVFGALIGLICGVNCLVVDGIGYFWVDAARQQAEIMRSVAANVSSLPHGSLLLLDGVCRYSGPGIVFETDDTAGALQLAFEDFTLNGDVISPNTHFDDASIDTTAYGELEEQYRYGNNVLVYNVPNKTLIRIPSKAAADGYLKKMNPTENSGCPAAREGDGAQVY